jgi:hypothetical protein
MYLIRLLAGNFGIIVRSLLMLLGCAAVWWGFVVHQVAAKETLIERIANKIIAGEVYKSQTLTQQLPTINLIDSSAYCEPAAIRSATIIKLRLVEVRAISNDHVVQDESLKFLIKDIDRSLSCEPADPFLWLVLFWMKNLNDGTKSEYLNLLRLSYRLGKNEGWIAIKRNYIAFSMFRQLPPDLADAALDEFVRLVESKLFDRAQEIFIGPAWPERNLILKKMARIPSQDRQYFLDMIRKRGKDINELGIVR